SPCFRTAPTLYKASLSLLELRSPGGLAGCTAAGVLTMRLMRFVIVVYLLLMQLGAGRARAQDVGATATWTGLWNGVDLTVVVVARGHDIPENIKRTEPWWR